MSTDLAVLEAMPPQERLAALLPIVVHANADPRLTKLYDRTADELAGRSAKEVAREFAHTTPDTEREVQDRIETITSWNHTNDPRLDQKYKDAQGELIALMAKRDELKARRVAPPAKSTIAKAAAVAASATKPAPVSTLAATAKQLREDTKDLTPASPEGYLAQVLPDKFRNELNDSLWSQALQAFHACEDKFSNAQVSAMLDLYTKQDPTDWHSAEIFASVLPDLQAAKLSPKQMQVVASLLEKVEAAAWEMQAAVQAAQLDAATRTALVAHFGGEEGFKEQIERTNLLIRRYMERYLPTQEERQNFLNTMMADGGRLGSNEVLVKFLSDIAVEFGDELDEGTVIEGEVVTS